MRSALGNGNDLLLSAPGIQQEIHVGLAGGTTPWKGLSGGTFIGSLFADDDFILEGAGLALGNHENPGSVTIVATRPVTAFVTRGVTNMAESDADYRGVTFSVASGAKLVAVDNEVFGRAAGVHLDAGAALMLFGFGGKALSQTINSLTGEGDVLVLSQTRDPQPPLTLIISEADSTLYAGSILDGQAALSRDPSEAPSIVNLAKMGIGRWTLAGANSYHGSTIVNQGTLAIGVQSAVPATTAVTVAAGAGFDLDGHVDTIGSLAGAGSVLLGAGGALTARADGSSTTFSGTVTGAGSLAKAGTGELLLTNANPLTGTLGVTGGTLRLAGPAAAASAVSLISVSTGGTLHLDSRTASGGNHATNDRLSDTAPVELRGGTILLSGADNAVTTEALGQLSPVSGASTVQVAAGNGGSATLGFASLGTREDGATVNFAASPLGGDNKVTVGGQAVGFIGGWAIANRADFAKYDAVQGVVPFATGDYSADLGAAGHLLINTSNADLPNNVAALTAKIDASASPLNLIQQFTTLNLTQRGLLKVGTNAASITGASGTIAGGGPTSELIVFTEGGDLTIGSRIAGGMLTKSGAGKLILNGPVANTFTGPTFVNEGTLELSKTAADGAITSGDVTINGGTLRLAAADQIHDNAVVMLNSGTFTLGGFNEKVKNVIVNGGVFESGSGVLTLTEASFNGGRSIIGNAPPPQAASPVSASGPVHAPAPPVVSTAAKVIVSGGDNSVEVNSRLVVGTDGLTFNGKGTPTIRLAAGDGVNAPGTLFLNGNIFVNDAGTRAAITGGGTVDLNGARFFTPDPNTELNISTTITNGNFSKDGQGLLRLSGPATLTAPTRVIGGTLQFDTASSLTGGTVVLSAGLLSLLLTLDSGTHVGIAAADVQLDGDAAFTPDETNPDYKHPGQITLQKLFTAGVFPTSLTVSSPNVVTAEFTSAVFNAPVKLDLASPFQINGPISGTAVATFTKDGVAALALGGTTANTFRGMSVIEGGTVELQKPKGIDAIPGDVTIKGTGTRIRLQASEQINNASAVEIDTGSTLDLNGFDETVGSISISGTGRVVTGGGNLIANSITLSTGGSIMVRSEAAPAQAVAGGHASAGGAALVVHAINLAGGGTIDVSNNALIVDYDAASPSPLSDVRQRVRTAYLGTGGGPWTGLGITSSVARGDAATAVGYAEAADVLTFDGKGKSTFFGHEVDATSVLARYTLTGDANLDGAVGFSDLVAVAQHYGTQGSGNWSGGDFNYDGNIDFADLVSVAQHYGVALSTGALPDAPVILQADLASASSSVPEPSGFVLVLAAALAGAVSRRRRRGPKHLTAIAKIT